MEIPPKYCCDEGGKRPAAFIGGADNGKDTEDEVDVEEAANCDAAARATLIAALRAALAVVFAGVPLEVGNGTVAGATDG